MTVAICFKCGAFKHGAITPCPKCGASPTTQEDKANSIAMSDHHFDAATLERMSNSIQEGRIPYIDPALIAGYQSAMGSDIGMRIMNAFGDFKAHKATQVQRPKRRDENFESVRNETQIATVVCCAFRDNRGVGYRHNPFLEEEIIETAKTFLKKPFFSSWSSFIPRAALTSERVFEMFAPRIYLTAQSDEVRNRFWDGQGNYIREITLASINSFSGYGRLAAFGLFLPESVYMEIRRYLEEP